MRKGYELNFTKSYCLGVFMIFITNKTKSSIFLVHIRHNLPKDEKKIT